MADILIESLYSTGGTMPESGIDTTSLYSAWSLNDVAQLGLATTDTLTIPGNYVVGDDLTLVIKEQTPGVSQRHKWQAVCTLNSGDPTTFTAEYVSSATANTETTRLFTISTAGGINSIAIAGGDELEIAFSRLAASGTEDANEIRVHSFNLRVSVEPVSVVFSGRLNNIATGIRAAFNERNPGNSPFLTDLDILCWVNQCKNDLALENICTRWSLLDWPISGQIDLRAELPDLIQVFQDEGTCLRMDDTDYPNGQTMEWVPNVAEWTYRYTDPGQWSPWPNAGCCFLDRDTLNLLPTQTAQITDGINLKNSYQPVDLTGTGTAGMTPPTPAPFDILYIYYGLWFAFMKEERDATRRNPKSREYQALYQAEKQRLLRKKAPRVLGVTPYI